MLLSCRRSWRAEDLSSIKLQLVNSRVIVADTGLDSITAQVKGSSYLAGLPHECCSGVERGACLQASRAIQTAIHVLTQRASKSTQCAPGS